MVFGFIKLCRKLAMSQVFYCTYFLPFLKKKYVYIKLSLFFHPCSTFYPVSPCQGFLLMVQSKRMPLGKHYQYCCKADAPTAKKKQEWKRKGMRGTEHDSTIPSPTCSLLPPPVSQHVREASGTVEAEEEEECFLFGEGKRIDISRNRPRHVDISLPLLRGRLSVRWIKLSQPIPPFRPLKPLHPWQSALTSLHQTVAPLAWAATDGD